MSDLTADLRRGRSPRLRLALLAALMCSFFAAGVSQASASMIIQNHLNPAGDPIQVPYHMGPGANPSDFSLSDGGQQAFGGPAGQFTAQALPPAGYKVTDIQCIGPRNDFVVNVAAGTATINRVNVDTDEQICSFTISRVTASAPPPAAGTGVAPSVPSNIKSSRLAPAARSEVRRVKLKQGLVTANVFLAKRAVVRSRLLWRGNRVVGSSRAEVAAGVWDVTVGLDTKRKRQFRRQGLKRVRLTLRVVVAERGGPTRVFRIGVLLRP